MIKSTTLQASVFVLTLLTASGGSPERPLFQRADIFGLRLGQSVEDVLQVLNEKGCLPGKKSKDRCTYTYFTTPSTASQIAELKALMKSGHSLDEAKGRLKTARRGDGFETEHEGELRLPIALQMAMPGPWLSGEKRAACIRQVAIHFPKKDGDSKSISIYFEEDPRNDLRSIVVHVSYSHSYPAQTTAESAQKIFDAAVKKYGVASKGYRRDEHQWLHFGTSSTLIPQPVLMGTFSKRYASLSLTHPEVTIFSKKRDRYIHEIASSGLDQPEPKF